MRTWGWVGGAVLLGRGKPEHFRTRVETTADVRASMFVHRCHMYLCSLKVYSFSNSQRDPPQLNIHVNEVNPFPRALSFCAKHTSHCFHEYIPPSCTLSIHPVRGEVLALFSHHLNKAFHHPHLHPFQFKFAFSPQHLLKP